MCHTESKNLTDRAMDGNINSAFGTNGRGKKRYKMHGLIFKLPQYFENIFTCMLRMLRKAREAIVRLHSLHCIHL